MDYLRNLRSAIALSMGYLLATPLALHATQESVTAFVNVTVVPMDAERVLAGQTVLVRGSRIAAIGPAKQIAVPTGAVRVDGTGKFLIPGLADMHAHIHGQAPMLQRLQNGGLPFSDEVRVESERHLFLYLAGGVTTVRVMYGWPETVALRKRAASGELLSPRIYAASPPFYPQGVPLGIILASPSAAAKFVDSAKVIGYDFIKMYGLAGETFDSLSAAARRARIPIAGHLPSYPIREATMTGHNIEHAIRGGYTSIEHLLENQWPIDNEAELHRIAAALRRAGVWVTPTLVRMVLNAGFSVDTVAQWPELRYVVDTLRKSWQKQAVMEAGAQNPAAIEIYRTMIKVLRDAGVGLLLGTDAGTAFVLPGFSVPRELQTLVQLGLTPYEALASGTRNVAVYFGTLDSTGTVAKGKRADLVLLNGNPLHDIRHTAQPAGVMIGGRWLAREELDRRLAALVGRIS